MERILVSACLLGLRCRYSGERKADERVSGLLKRQDVVLIPVCPEQAFPHPGNLRREGTAACGTGPDRK